MGAELIRLLIVACRMLSHSSSMGVRSCWILVGHVSYTSIQSIPNMLNGVTWLVSMEAMEEQGHFQLPGIVYISLSHGAMHYHAET